MISFKNLTKTQILHFIINVLQQDTGCLFQLKVCAPQLYFLHPLLKSEIIVQSRSRNQVYCLLEAHKYWHWYRCQNWALSQVLILAKMLGCSLQYWCCQSEGVLFLISPNSREKPPSDLQWYKLARKWPPNQSESWEACIRHQHSVLTFTGKLLLILILDTQTRNQNTPFAYFIDH